MDCDNPQCIGQCFLLYCNHFSTGLQTHCSLVIFGYGKSVSCRIISKRHAQTREMSMWIFLNSQSLPYLWNESRVHWGPELFSSQWFHCSPWKGLRRFNKLPGTTVSDRSSCTSTSLQLPFIEKWWPFCSTESVWPSSIRDLAAQKRNRSWWHMKLILESSPHTFTANIGPNWGAQLR